MIRTRSLYLLGLVFSLGTLAFAQATDSNPPQTTQPPSNRPAVEEPHSAPNAPSTAKKKSKEEIEIERREQSQTILGVIPQYGVTSRRDAPPLSSGEKFHLMLRSTVNPFEFVAVGLQAGWSQAENQFPAYGQGAEGYGKRYGAAYADQAASNFFSNFAYPVLFKQDPRYFRLGDGSFRHRLLYSLGQEFSSIRDTDRKRTFNYSNILGAITSGAISNAYYPRADRGVGDTFQRAGIAVVYGSIGGLADEFWPDVHDKLFGHRKKQPDADQK